MATQGGGGEERTCVSNVLESQIFRRSIHVIKWVPFGTSYIHKFHKDTFPNMLKLAAFTLNLPVHTADCERGFSLQNNVKNSQ